MIAVNRGICFICHRPTERGVDEYDADARRSYHLSCYLDVIYVEEPAQEAEKLAIRLGYSKSASPA